MKYLRIWPLIAWILVVPNLATAEEESPSQLQTGYQWLAAALGEEFAPSLNLKVMFLKVSHGPFDIHPVTTSSYFYARHPARRNEAMVHYQSNHNVVFNRTKRRKSQLNLQIEKQLHWFNLAKNRLQDMATMEFNPVSMGMTFDNGDPGLVIKNIGDKKIASWPMKLFDKLSINKDEVVLEFRSRW